MNIRPKSPELVQAQIAAFAAENVERFDARKAIFDSIGSLAVGNVAEVTYKTKSNEYLRDENDNYIIQDDDLAMIPKGTELTVATKDEYTQWLRSVGGSKHEAIATRASLLEQYKEFEPEVAPIIKELEADASTYKDHPAYLGSGSNTSAFRISHGGKEYVARLGGRAGHPLARDARAEVLARAKGIPHLEQVVAMSYDDSTVITELMPGKELGYDTPIEDLRQITDEQLSDLVDTVIAATEHGISIDPKPSNILYDTEQGFGIIDLNPANKADLGYEIGNVSTSLSTTGSWGGGYSKTTVDAYARDLEYKKEQLDIQTRYRAAAVAKLDGHALSSALEVIDKNIEYAHDSIEQLSDPSQVEAMIARAKEAQKPKTGSWTSV